MPMFKNAIQDTPLTTMAADDYFPNVIGSSYCGDVSLVATLRALIAPRMSKDDRLIVRFGQSSYNAAVVSSAPVNRMLEQICCDYPLRDEGYMFIHSFASNKQENNIACMELVRRQFCESYPTWQQFPDITEVMKSVVNVLCFVNPETRSTILFVEKLNLQNLHFLQAAIIGVVPWYYQLGTEISPLEKELMQSFLEKTSDKYLACLAKFVELFDFEALRLKRLLTGFETRQMRNQLQQVERNLSNKRRDFDSYNNALASILADIDSLCVQQMGLDEKIRRTDENSELLEYFLCNRNVVLERVDGDKLYFYVKGYATFYDEEAVRGCLRNPYSFVYSYTHDGLTNAQIKKLITAVFIDEKIKLRLCAAYTLDTVRGINPNSYHNFGQDAESYMPNPHINRYSCMGNYSSTINRLIKDKDFIGAVAQTVASAQSLNWADSIVMKEFFRMVTGNPDVHDNHNCAFELPDGSVVKPVDAIRWLEQQEAATNNEGTEGT